MKEYTIDVDLTLSAKIVVEAKTEEEARLLAYDEVNSMTVGNLKEWQSDYTVKNVKYIWTAEDMDKWDKVWADPDDYTDEEDVNTVIENGDIIFIATDRQGAYKLFCDDNDLDELRENGINPSFNWFCSELDKGYHESGSIEIARLIETSNGIFYDKEYV